MKRGDGTKHLQFIAETLMVMPYWHLARRRAKELVERANKRQIRLGKIKRLICKKCFSVLIPKITAVSDFVKRRCGYGLCVRCTRCGCEKTFVHRGYKGRWN